MKRRTVLRGFAALAPLAGFGQLHAQSIVASGECRLISHDVLGPFAIEKPPMRSDLVVGQPGTPLKLKFLVQSALSCEPLPGALVSIFHANAVGLYSSVENIVLGGDGKPTGEKVDYRSEDWLRGMQKSDENGMVEFNTILPGWYFPRPVHIHLQVFPPDFGEVATTQLYIPDAATDNLFREGAYAARGPNPLRTDPTKDSPLDGTDEGDLWLNLRPEGQGLVAEHKVGVMHYGGMFGELPDHYRQG